MKHWGGDGWSGTGSGMPVLDPYSSVEATFESGGYPHGNIGSGSVAGRPRISSSHMKPYAKNSKVTVSAGVDNSERERIPKGNSQPLPVADTVMAGLCIRARENYIRIKEQ